MTNGRVRRFGSIIPSSNTVVEPRTTRLLPPDGSVEAHFSRFRVVTLSASEGSLSQFTPDALLAAAGLLADAKVDLILWNGTAASWLGFDYDERLVAAIEGATGIPAATAVLAINARLAALGAKRIGLVTPYVAELEERIVANYAGAGLTVVAAERKNLTDNTDFGALPPAEIGAMVRRVAAARPDAIVIMCTNLAGGAAARAIEAELGVPVLDSVDVAVEAALSRLAGQA